MSHGYIMLRRSDATYELLKDPNAFVLLTVIALRAKRTNVFSVYGLKAGQALVGDFQAYGLTRGQYRAAKARLKRYGLADFHGTHRGTVAMLLSDAVFDINTEPPATSRRQANDQPATTNNNGKNGKKGKGPPVLSSGPVSKTFAEMDRERVATALAQAQKEFLTDEQA